MNYKPLGSSGLLISEVSFGCMSLGEDDAANATLLHQAFEQGINFFDTADIYQKGRNEITLGKAFKDIRKQVLIATKVGNQLRSDGSGLDWNPRKAYILKAVEESLARLKTDYIDLYQLHGGTIDDPIDETIEAFEILKTQGKIRHYGISSIRPNVIREYISRSSIVSVMMQYSLLDRRPEETCLDLLLKNNIGVLTRGSLAKGLLVNKPAAPYLDYTAAQVGQLSAVVKQLQHQGRSAAEPALKYVLQHPAVASAVTGIRTLKQLEDILHALSLNAPLWPEEMELLRAAVPVNYYDQHR